MRRLAPHSNKIHCAAKKRKVARKKKFRPKPLGVSAIPRPTVRWERAYSVPTAKFVRINREIGLIGQISSAKRNADFMIVADIVEIGRRPSTRGVVRVHGAKRIFQFAN